MCQALPPAPSPRAKSSRSQAAGNELLYDQYYPRFMAQYAILFWVAKDSM